MKTRRIYGKKNKTVSKRNKKKNSATKRVYRRKTMKGGVTTPAYFNRPPTTRSEVLTPGLKHQKKYTQEAYKKKKKIAKNTNRNLNQYKK